MHIALDRVAQAAWEAQAQCQTSVLLLRLKVGAFNIPYIPEDHCKGSLKALATEIIGNICQRIWGHCTWVSWLSLGQRLLLQQQEINDCTLNCSIASVHFVSLQRFFHSWVLPQRRNWKLEAGLTPFLFSSKMCNNAERVLCAEFNGELPDGTARHSSRLVQLPALYGTPAGARGNIPTFSLFGTPPSPGKAAIFSLPWQTLSVTFCWHETISPVASHLPAHSRLLELTSDICGCVTFSCQKSQCPLHSGVLSLVLGAENRSNISAACRSPPCQSNSCLCLSKVYFTAL